MQAENETQLRSKDVLLLSMKKDIDWKTDRVKSLETELSESNRKVDLIEKDNLKCKGDLEWARDYCQTVNNKIKELEKQLNQKNSTSPVLPEFKPSNILTPVLSEARLSNSQNAVTEPPITIKCEPTPNITPSTPKQTVYSTSNVSLESISVTNVAPKIKKEKNADPVPSFSSPSCSIQLVPAKAKEPLFSGKRIESQMGRYTVTAATSSPEMVNKVARKSLTSMSGKNLVAEVTRKSLDSPMIVRQVEPVIDLTTDEPIEEMARKGLDSVLAKTLVDMPKKRGRPRKIVK